MLNITQIPSQRVPVVDLTTGLMTREWFRFFDYVNTVLPHTDVYSPTASAAVNVTVNSISSCQYVQNNQFVTVSGIINATPTTPGFWRFEFTLPVASTFTNSTQASGVLGDAIKNGGGIINANLGTNTFRVRSTATTSIATEYSFVATYQVL